MKSILIYYSSSQISIDLTSLMLELRNNSFRVYFLSHCEKGNLQLYLEKQGVKVESIKKIGYLKKIYHLIYYCNKNKIDVVNSHTQVNNFILSIAQFFIKAKCIMTRHHSDYVYNGNNRMAKLFDKIINKLSKNIIAISEKVKDQMINVERVSLNKIIRINNAYDFSLFPPVNKKIKNKIVTNYNLTGKDIVLLNIGRMIPIKRQALLLELVYLLKKEDFHIKLLIIGSGQLKKRLVKIAEDFEITNEVVFTNQVNNIRDYMACCDLQVHLSESEASNNVVKEFALLGKPSIICKNVGDFEDYCTRKNSYLIPKDFSIINLKSIIVQIINDKQDLVRKGEEMRSTVKSIFSIDNVIPKYLELFN